MEAQTRANEQDVSNLEELAERVHATRMASCEERFAKLEHLAAIRELGPALSTKCHILRRSMRSACKSSAISNSTVLLRNSRSSCSPKLPMVRKEEMDATMDAAKEQQDEVADRLVATERALRFLEEALLCVCFARLCSNFLRRTAVPGFLAKTSSLTAFLGPLRLRRGSEEPNWERNSSSWNLRCSNNLTPQCFQVQLLRQVWLCLT